MREFGPLDSFRQNFINNLLGCFITSVFSPTMAAKNPPLQFFCLILNCGGRGQAGEESRKISGLGFFSMPPVTEENHQT